MNNSIVITVDLKISYARYVVCELFPYFASILSRFRYVERNHDVETMAITKDGVVYYNKSYIEKLHNFQLNFILLHELLHFIYLHHRRKEDQDPEIWNIAADLVVNNDLLDISKKTPKIKVIDGAVTVDSYIPALPTGLTVEQYYDLLAQPMGGSGGSLGKTKSKSKVGDGGGVGRGECGSGAGGNPIENEAADDPGINDEEDWNIVRQNIAKNLQELDISGRGLVPAGMFLWATKTYAKPKISWKNKFKNVFSSAVNHILGSVDYTFRKPSSKQYSVYGYGPGSVILPSLYAPDLKIGVGLDTSGSMDKKRIEIALREINGIIRTASNNVSFYACDAEVHSVAKVNSINQVIKNLRGGGGTFLSPIFDKMKALKDVCDIIIIVTDGYSDVPTNQPKNSKVIYVVVGGVNPGYKGEVIFIKD